MWGCESKRPSMQLVTAGRYKRVNPSSVIGQNISLALMLCTELHILNQTFCAETKRNSNNAFIKGAVGRIGTVINKLVINTIQLRFITYLLKPWLVLVDVWKSWSSIFRFIFNFLLPIECIHYNHVYHINKCALNYLNHSLLHSHISWKWKRTSIRCRGALVLMTAGFRTPQPGPPLPPFLQKPDTSAAQSLSWCSPNALKPAPLFSPAPFIWGFSSQSLPQKPLAGFWIGRGA